MSTYRLLNFPETIYLQVVTFFVAKTALCHCFRQRRGQLLAKNRSVLAVRNMVKINDSLCITEIMLKYC